MHIDRVIARGSGDRRYLLSFRDLKSRHHVIIETFGGQDNEKNGASGCGLGCDYPHRDEFFMGDGR